MRTLGNILWHFPYLGFLFALSYFIWGIICCITIIFFPFGKGYINYSAFLLSPFKKEMVSESDLVYLGREKKSIISKGYNILLKILYFPFGLINAFFIILLIVAEFCTILGIPAALVWAKSLGTLFCPIGKVRVSREEAELIKRRKVEVMYSRVDVSTFAEEVGRVTDVQSLQSSKYSLDFSIIDYIKSSNPRERLKAISVILAGMCIISTVISPFLRDSSIRLAPYIDLIWLIDILISPILSLSLNTIIFTAAIAWFYYMIKNTEPKALLRIPLLIGIVISLLRIIADLAFFIGLVNYQHSNIVFLVFSFVSTVSYVWISVYLKKRSLSQILLVSYCIVSIIICILNVYKIIEPMSLSEFTLEFKKDGGWYYCTLYNIIFTILYGVVNILFAAFMYIFGIERDCHIRLKSDVEPTID